MTGETLNETPPIIQACENKFSEAFVEWGNGGEAPLMSVNPISGGAVEAICLSAPEGTLSNKNGVTFFLMRMGVDNPGVSISTIKSDGEEESVDLVFGIILVPRDENDTRSASELELSDLAQANHMMILSNGTVESGIGSIDGDILDEISEAIAGSEVVQLPSWLEETEE